MNFWPIDLAKAFNRLTGPIAPVETDILSAVQCITMQGVIHAKLTHSAIP